MTIEDFLNNALEKAFDRNRIGRNTQTQTMSLRKRKLSIDLDDNRMYTVKDVQAILGRGKRQTYELFHTDGFPSIRIGNGLRVEKKAFEKWLERNQGKRIWI